MSSKKSKPPCSSLRNRRCKSTRGKPGVSSLFVGGRPRSGKPGVSSWRNPVSVHCSLGKPGVRGNPGVSSFFVGCPRLEKPGGNPVSVHFSLGGRPRLEKPGVSSPREKPGVSSLFLVRPSPGRGFSSIFNRSAICSVHSEPRTVGRSGASRVRSSTLDSLCVAVHFSLARPSPPLEKPVSSSRRNPVSVHCSL